MKWRIGLAVLQAVGSLSILPYPAVLVANVMSIAGEGPRGMQRILMAIPYLLLTLYPLAWLALYAQSWRLISRGATGPAFALSFLPVLASLAAGGFLMASDRTARGLQETAARSERALVEEQNPLVWTILCTGPRRPPAAPQVSFDAALTAIRSSQRLNDPARPYGTPLRTALINLSYHFDGSPADHHQQGLERLVRALIGGGARLSAEENGVMDNVWRLRRATFEGPVTTRSENPLVWRILATADPRGPYIRDGKQFQLRPDDTPLLNRSTLLHGTPLYTAVRLGGTRLMADLVQAGAQLSPEEQGEPAAVARLHKLLAGER